MYDQMFGNIETFEKFFKENDSEENRRAILKTDLLKVRYCSFIEDRPELWEALETNEGRYNYVTWCRFRPEVAAKIKDDYYIFRLLTGITGIDEDTVTALINNVTKDSTRYRLCLNGFDRKALWSKITSNYWAVRYVTHIKPRHELKAIAQLSEQEWAKLILCYKKGINIDDFNPKYLYAKACVDYKKELKNENRKTNRKYNSRRSR